MHEQDGQEGFRDVRFHERETLSGIQTPNQENTSKQTRKLRNHGKWTRLTSQSR